MAVKRGGELVTWSYTEYLRDITSVAKAFIHLGLEQHNGVAIWGFNSPEWFISDVAAIFAGGVVSWHLQYKTFVITPERLSPPPLGCKSHFEN